MRTVLIIPALNEEAAIGGVVAAVPRVVSRIIVVDNGSTDGTAAVAAAAGADVIREPKRGYGAACMAGVQSDPDADIYAFLDGDGSDPAERLPELICLVSGGGFDLVLGVRRGNVERGSMLWHQRLGNIFMSWLIRRLTGSPIHDLPSFKVVSGTAMRTICPVDRGFGWTAELITACAARRLRICEVETGYRVRTGVSKVSGSPSASLKAGYRLNVAILGTWLRERAARRVD